MRSYKHRQALLQIGSARPKTGRHPKGGVLAQS
jgi:hypothetical protein